MKQRITMMNTMKTTELLPVLPVFMYPTMTALMRKNMMNLVSMTNTKLTNTKLTNMKMSNTKMSNTKMANMKTVNLKMMNPMMTA